MNNKLMSNSGRQSQLPQSQPQQRVYFSLLKRVGAQGSYQFHLLLILILIGIVTMSSFYVTPFLFYVQDYQCPNYHGDCNQKVCAMPANKRASYEPSSPLTTLGSEFGDSRCGDTSQTKGMQEMLMLGPPIGLILGVLFTECLMRKGTILTALGISAVGVVLTAAFDSIVMKSIGLLLWSLGSETAYSIVFNIVTEQTGETIRKKYYGYLVIIFSVSSLMNAGLFALFRHWRVVLLCFYLLGLVLGFLLYFFFIEHAPIELVGKCSAEQAHAAFTRIAERNGVTNHGLTVDEIKQIQDEYLQNNQLKHGSQFSFLDVLRYPSVRGDFLRLSFCFFILMLNLYGPSLLLGSFHFNIYLLAVINGVSSLLALPVIFATVDSQPRRKTMVVLFAITALFAAVLIFVTPQCEHCDTAGSALLFLIVFLVFRFCSNLVAKFFTCCWNESFPAQIRPIAIYAVVGVGVMARIPIPYLTSLKDSLHVPLMLVFTVALVIGIGSACLIRQTLGIPPREIIQELDMHSHHYKYHHMPQEQLELQQRRSK